jgi:hypothetical protein
MNRNLRSILSVSIAGTVLAIGLHVAAPRYQTMSPENGARVDAFLSGVRDVLPEAKRSIGAVIAHVQTWAGLPATAAYDQNVVMLKEPVVILNGSWDNALSLASGTHLGFVQNDGQYLRVKHERRVITIPRSAAVPGTYHGR